MPQLLGGWTGPISYISKSDRMRNARSFQTISPVEPPKVVVMEKHPDRVDFAAMKNKLFANTDRQNWLVRDVLMPLVEKHQRRLLYVSDMVEPLHQIKERLHMAAQDTSIAETFCESDAPAKLLRAVESPIILTTYGKASEALDLPDGPNTVVLDITCSFVKQTAGRVFRGHNTPWVVLVGDEGTVFTRQHSERVQYCREYLKWKMELRDDFHEFDSEPTPFSAPLSTRPRGQRKRRERE